MKLWPTSLVFLVVVAFHATAEEGDEPESLDKATVDGDDIVANLRSGDEAVRFRSFGFLEDWDEKREEFNERIGLDYNLTYHAVIQAVGFSDDVDTGGSGDLTFQGVWEIGKNLIKEPSELRFRFRNRHRILSDPASQLDDNTGAYWGFVDGFNDAGFEIPDMYLQHYFEERDILLRYGQLTIDDQFDSNNMRGAKRSFLNQAFSSSPAVAFPSFGAGATLKARIGKRWDLTVGASTVQGTENGTSVDWEWNSDSLFTAVQLTWEPKSLKDRKGRFQIMGWHSDEVPELFLSEGHGLAATYEQELAVEDWRMFARFAWSSGEATNTALFISTGVSGPCGDDARIGFAAALGQSSRSNSELQGVLEAFCRWSPRKDIQITPDLQVVFGDGFNGTPGIRFVGGIRLGIVF